MVIDTHVHIYPPDVIKKRDEIAEREDYFRLLTASRVHKWATAEDLLAAMDEDGVDESWVFGFAFNDLGLCRHCNDYVLEASSRSRGRMKPMIVVPPRAKGMEEEIARGASFGAIGVGELFPDGQGFDLRGGCGTEALAGACLENGLFLMLHTAEPVGRKYAGKGETGPREAFAFASGHRELRVVFAHLGGGLFFYEQMPDVADVLRNVRYDTAAAPFLYRPSVIRSAVSSGTLHKLLYGSDYPLLRHQRYRKMFSAHLSGHEIRAVLSGNADRFLNASNK